jgi:hypothetical protein
MLPGLRTPLPPAKVALSAALEPEVMVVAPVNTVMVGGAPMFTTKGTEIVSGVDAALLMTAV